MDFPKTVKLYDDDAYATEFFASVLSCQPVEGKDVYSVILDKTLFFPEEGGQSPDKGTLNDATVIDVQINNDVICHTVTSPLEVGAIAVGKLDWDHRFNNMQQHSGEHIFSGLVHKRFGFDNVGFHLSDQIVTMDFNGVIPAKDIEEIELEVNKAIAKNFETIVSFPSKEELDSLEYRSKIEIDGQVRIVTYPGYDVCACCAPHVRRTGEIGCLKVMSVSNYKGGVRVSILCGLRALAAFKEKETIVNDLTSLFTCGQDIVVDNVKKQKESLAALKSELANAKKELMSIKLASIPSDLANVILFESNLDTNVLRQTVNDLTEKHDGYCAIFNGDDAAGYNFIIGSKTKDCKDLAAKLREKFSSKGGGSNVMIQGSISAKAADIESFINTLQ